MNCRICKSPVIVKTFQTAATLICMICVLLLLSGNVWGSGKDDNISATLEPQNITLGDVSILSVHISGTGAGKPVIPHVDGLRFITSGQSSKYQFINGNVSASISYINRVLPDRPGDFTIPPITTDTGGRGKTQPLTLHVVKSQKSGINAVPSPTPQAQPPGSSTRLEESEIGQTAFLRVIPATHRPYVGETVPVEIRAYFRRGVRATVNSLPVPEGSVFSFQSISEKPRQTEE
ncbi:MAG: BatD family protein, partial [Deltaproteobacteria bacterium]|nr:BatD family protein [Deltaproteobacteria bacterium]